MPIPQRSGGRARGRRARAPRGNVRQRVGVVRGGRRPPCAQGAQVVVSSDEAKRLRVLQLDTGAVLPRGPVRLARRPGGGPGWARPRAKP